MTKQQALDILHAHMKNENLRRHCYGVGFAMVGIFEYLKKNNWKEDSPDSAETWEVLGILHDSDYELTKDNWDQHTLLTLQWMKDTGIKEDDPLYLAEMSHNNPRTNLREPQTQMEWALECCDELTGFIVACALVKSGKLSEVTLETVKKKWKQKAFAAAVERGQIEQCKERLGIELDIFINIVLKAMQDNSEKLGL